MDMGGGSGGGVNGKVLVDLLMDLKGLDDSRAMYLGSFPPPFPLPILFPSTPQNRPPPTNLLPITPSPTPNPYSILIFHIEPLLHRCLTPPFNLPVLKIQKGSDQGS